MIARIKRHERPFRCASKGRETLVFRAFEAGNRLWWNGTRRTRRRRRLKWFTGACAAERHRCAPCIDAHSADAIVPHGQRIDRP